MKLTVFSILFLLLVACAPQLGSKQKVTNLTEEKPVVSVPIPNITTQNTTKPAPVQNITVAAPKDTPPQYKILTTTNGTAWIDQQTPSSIKIKSKVHTIEVVDVDEGENGCLIRVDGTTTMIDEDESAIINGVKITVLDVRAFRSKLEDNDACQIIIS